jgi:hypothetical protein
MQAPTTTIQAPTTTTTTMQAPTQRMPRRPSQFTRCLGFVNCDGTHKCTNAAKLDGERCQYCLTGNKQKKKCHPSNKNCTFCECGLLCAKHHHGPMCACVY